MTKKTEKKKVPKKEVIKKQEPEIIDNKMGIISGSDQIVKGGVPRQCNNVAIVGFAPSSMRDVTALFGDPDTEIWTLNQIYMAFPMINPDNRPDDKKNFTRWFQIHHRSSYDQTVNRDVTHHEWLARQTNFPIYMQEKNPDIPMSIEFPKDEILKNFRKYFTNTISWMLALAVKEGFKKIHLYGVDMAMDGEYSFERPSVEYFLGFVEGG